MTSSTKPHQQRATFGIDEEVFFGPYGVDQLVTILAPGIQRAFMAGSSVETNIRIKYGSIRRIERLFRLISSNSGPSTDLYK